MSGSCSLCPKYSCYPYDSVLDTSAPSECGEYFSTNSSVVLSTLCPLESEHCDLDDVVSDTTAYCSDSVDLLPAGFSGDYNDECIAGSLTDGYCSGLAPGASCSSNNECGVNYFCDEGVCTEGQNEGESCSIKQCKSYLVCANTKCTEVGSLEGGVQIGYGDQEFACKSQTHMHLNFEYYCVNSSRLTSEIEQTASLSEACSYDIAIPDYSLTQTSDAKCGFAENGHAFCTPGYNDGNMAVLLEDLYEYLRAKPDCPILDNTVRDPPSFLCNQGREVGRDLYEHAVIGYYTFFHYADIQNVTASCLKNYTHPLYWEIAGGNREYSVGFGALLLLIASYLF